MAEGGVVRIWTMLGYVGQRRFQKVVNGYAKVLHVIVNTI